jgi:hypothetical protein
MIWKKPANMKYTDMCIYIDENVHKIINPGENPDIENTIYNYLWLLVKALAIKKCMFTNFQDYDMYAFYAANRLFFALRKNLVNQGKTVKGKLIRPIKSSLNYTKALLYPMKIEFQRESYREVLDEEFMNKKFDAFAYKAQLKNQAKAGTNISEDFKNHLQDVLPKNSQILDDILQKSPFNSTTPEYQNLKITVLLNSILMLKNKKKLDVAPQSVVLWHLPKSMANYTKVLIKEFFMALKLEIMDCYRMVDINDTDLENILNSALEVNSNEEQY